VKIITIITMIILSSNLLASEKEKYAKNYSAGISVPDGSLLLKMILPNKYALVGSLNFDFLTSRDVDTVASIQNPDDKSIRTTKITRTNVDFSLGIRKYLTTYEYKIFVQPSVGVALARNKFKISDSSNSEIRFFPSNNSNTIGVVTSFVFGVEYFISDYFSIEGIYGLEFKYFDYDLNKESKRKSKSLSEYGAVYLNYYWR